MEGTRTKFGKHRI